VSPITALAPARELFSLDERRIHDMLEHAHPAGQREDAAQLNLGFGFLYYALVRALRPAHVAVIGVDCEFPAVCLALGLKDNDRGFDVHYNRTPLDGIVSFVRHRPRPSPASIVTSKPASRWLAARSSA